MDEQEIIKALESEGHQKVCIYDAPPGEVDEEHQHDFDTHLVVLRGQIKITSLINGEVTSLSHQDGAHIDIQKGTPHSAKVGSDGCRYIVAEKH